MNDEYWDIAKNQYHIQQIREEWEWMIKKVSDSDKISGNTLEIGCYDGGSSWYLSRFAKCMVTIDNHPCRFNLEKFRENIAGEYHYISGNSQIQPTLDQIPDIQFDFAFIDGDHSYSGVKTDFYHVLPLLNTEKSPVPVTFHDIVMSDFHRSLGCYVGEFWEDLKKEHPEYQYEEFKTNDRWAGIGLVWVS